MKKIVLALTILLVTQTALAEDPKSKVAPKELKVGTVSNKDYKYLDGCGCQINDSTQKFDYENQDTWNYYLLSTYGEHPEKAWVNVKGKTIKLTMTKTTRDEDNFKVGYHFQDEFKRNNVSANLKYLVTSIVDEAETFEVDLMISEGNLKKTIHTTGVCGC